jgi:hypothetical protein
VTGIPAAGSHTATPIAAVNQVEAFLTCVACLMSKQLDGEQGLCHKPGGFPECPDGLHQQGGPDALRVGCVISVGSSVRTSLGQVLMLQTGSPDQCIVMAVRVLASVKKQRFKGTVSGIVRRSDAACALTCAAACAAP